MQYLLQSGYLSPEAIVRGGVTVLDVSRRNRNFKVVSDFGPSFLIKQGVTRSGRITVAREAAIYASLASICTCMPHCYEYDPMTGLMILELLDAGESAYQYHARVGRFGTLFARGLGGALGALHSINLPEPMRDSSPGTWTPSIFSIHSPDLDQVADMSSGAVDLLRVVQHHDDLCASLDSLNAGWTESAMIHGDIRWDNIVVVPSPGSRRLTRVRLVDWELAALGDPWWDVGSVFADYLGFWLATTPVGASVSPEQSLQLARYPIERMQPPMLTFWDAYIQRASHVIGLDEGPYRETAVTYAGARLVQAAFELAQGLGELNGTVVSLVQLGFNIMRRPLEAAAWLIGLPASSSRSRG